MSSLHNFSVRWTDKDGTVKNKDYSDLMTARKAQKWVEDNGGIDVDIAVVLAQVKVSEEPIEYANNK